MKNNLNSSDKIENMVADDKLEQLLNDPSIQLKFNDFEENNDLFGKYSKSDYIESLLYYGKNKIDNLDFVLDDHLEFFHKFTPFISEYVGDDPTKWYRNPISEAFTRYFMNSEEYFPIDTALIAPEIGTLYDNDRLSKMTMGFTSDVKNDKPLSKDKLEQLIVLMNDYSVFNRDEFDYPGLYEYAFRSLFEMDERIDDISYHKLMGAYCTDVLCAYQVDEHVYISDHISDGTAAYCGYRDSSNKHELRLSSKEFRHENVFSNLETLFNEILFIVENNSNLKEYSYEFLTHTRESLLKDKLGDEYFNDNYYDISTENDTRVRSNIYLLGFLERVSPGMYNKAYSSIVTGISDKGNETSVSKDIDGIDGDRQLDVLFEQVFSPEEISMLMDDPRYFKQLSLVYDQDGERKSMADFLVEKITAESELRKPNQEDADIEGQKVSFYTKLLYKSGYTQQQVIDNYASLIINNNRDPLYAKELPRLSSFFQQRIDINQDFSKCTYFDVSQQVDDYMDYEQHKSLGIATTNYKDFIDSQSIYSKKK